MGHHRRDGDAAMMRPDHGGRIVLERVSVSEVDAVYAVSLHAPEASWTVRATIMIATRAVVFEDAGDAPAWLVDQARAFLKLVARDCTGEPPEPWPKRLVRWRAPKA